MQVNRKFIFTVDQLELIRRLRNSGLTKEQVLCAFDSFECLDSNVNKSLNIPMTLQALQLQALQRLGLTVPGTVAIGNGTSVQLQDNRAQQLQQQQQQQQLHQQMQHQLSQLQSQQQKLQQQQVLNRILSLQGRPMHGTPGMPQAREDDGTAAKSASESGTVTENSNNSEDIHSVSGGRLPDGGEEGEVDSEEIKEFFSRGEISCLEEIKDFILKHNIKQQQIAVLAGVSQPYVSRYLRGDFNSMSDRSCCAIKKWYLMYRKNPMSIGAAASSALMLNGGTVGTPAPTVKKLISQASVDLTGLVSVAASIGSDLELFSCPRRERFVFRPNHLQILENYFVEDNYPSYDKREDIAKICNESTRDLVGRELTEKETVTVPIVSNWFANKRKDLKKLYKEEGLDASQVLLRSRGRPSHSYLDSPLIQSVLYHQANGTQSLEKLAVIGSNGSLPAAVGDAAGDAAALQFSVEIAAINQAIMSLTGQKPISVKTEKADISEYASSSCMAAAAAATTTVTADMS